MAKRKNSVALFEVITAAKKKEAATSATPPAALRTPKWWFKGKKKAETQPVADDFYAAREVAPMSPPAQLVGPADAPTAPSSGSAVVQRVVPAAYVAPTPERVTIPERHDGDAAFGLDFPAEQQTPARRALALFGFGARKLGIDSERREVTFRLRYTTAIIVGFALCVAVGLAYVTGRQTNRANAGASAMSSEQVRRGPILPGVLELKPDRVVTSGENTSAFDTDESDIEPVQPRKTNQSPVSPPVAPKAPTRQTVGDVEVGLPRTAGLNYVIIQSYPDRKSADEAQQALAAAGIKCTVERAPKGWTADSDWVSVIGVSGFPRTTSRPEYVKYVESINEVSKTYAGKSKIKKFEPHAYKWKQ